VGRGKRIEQNRQVLWEFGSATERRTRTGLLLEVGDDLWVPNVRKKK
jgi:hypothetical protein